MIGYPNKKQSFVKRSPEKEQSIRTRNENGLAFEDAINESNQYYRDLNIALIYKKPTPVQIVKVDYPKRSKAKIVEAYFKLPSTTDYNGIYQGHYIDFEAKQCALKTYFPFSAIHPHQIDHLRKVLQQGGIGFILLYFSYYDEVYYLEADKVIQQYDQPDVKSLPYGWIKQEGFLVHQGYRPRLHYLQIVDTLYVRGGDSWPRKEK